MLGVADTVVLAGVVAMIKGSVAVTVSEIVVVAMLVALKNVVGAVVVEIAIGHVAVTSSRSRLWPPRIREQIEKFYLHHLDAVNFSAELHRNLHKVHRWATRSGN